MSEMTDRYSAMVAGEEARQDDQMPPLARERENEAVAKARAVFDAARQLIATGMIQAVGYRVVIKLIDSILTLEEAEADVAPTLAEKGFEVKSEGQRKREQRGENHGVVIHLGPTAFDRLGGIPAWCDVGETVVFSRYAGTAVEHPPGSGNHYQLINDEDIFGKIV